jgi:FdhE protein
MIGNPAEQDSLKKGREMGQTETIQEKIQHRINQAEKEFPQYQSLLPFWDQILSIQEAFTERIRSGLNPKEDPRWKLKMEEGFPLLSWLDVPVDENLMEELFRILCQAAVRANAKFKEEIPKVEKWLEGKARDFTEWTRLFLQEDGKPFAQKIRDYGLDVDIMVFLFLNSWKPFLKALAREIGQKTGVSQKTWEKGYCPICGAMPLLSFIHEEGKRSGVCAACESTWSMPRIFCPYCENTQPEKLHYFFQEENEGLRLDVCNSCRHYLKTLDLRKKEINPVPVIEDLLTTHLDLWAQEKGYKKLPLFGKVFGGRSDHGNSFQSLAGKE